MEKVSPLLLLWSHEVKLSLFLADNRFKNSYVVIMVVADIAIETHLGPRPL